MHAFLERSVIEPLKQRPIAPVLASGLTLLTANDRHQQLLDRVVHGLARLLAENEELIRDRMREESPWWVPEFVDDKLHDRIVDGIARTLYSVSEDPSHPLRRQLDDLLTELDRAAARVAGDDGPGRVAQAAGAGQPDERPAHRVALARAQAGAGPAGGRRRATATPGGLERGLSALAEAALEDEALLAKIDEWIIGAVLRIVEQHRHEVGQLIAGTVSAWDPDETSRRIELQIGRDLQFIRINGTLVGGLVGLVLYAVTQMVGHGGR